MTVPRDPRTSRRTACLVICLLLAACSVTPAPAPSTPSGPVPSASLVATVAPSEAGSPEPSSTETGPVATACAAADLKVSHGLVEGTAGSRETEVVLVTAITCAVSATPAFAILDARGATLVATTPGQDVIFVVRPGGSYASDVQFANWCAEDPGYPLTLELRLAAESIEVSDGPFPEAGDMPPCTAGDVPTLSATSWAPSS